MCISITCEFISACVCFSNIEMSWLRLFLRCPHHGAILRSSTDAVVCRATALTHCHHILLGFIVGSKGRMGGMGGRGCQSNFNEMCYFDSQAQLIWNVSVEQAQVALELSPFGVWPAFMCNSHKTYFQSIPELWSMLLMFLRLLNIPSDANSFFSTQKKMYLNLRIIQKFKLYL